MRDTAPPGLLSGSMMIALAMGVMNLGTYGFTIIAARLLGPSEFGALAAVMGLLLVVNVVSLGLQATGARRVAAEPADKARIEADVLTASYKSAVALGLICLAATPLVTVVLRLDSWWVAALIAVTSVPLTVMGGQAGILQGERRWRPLAGIYLAVGLGRVGFGTVALLIAPSTLWAMVGVAAGAVVPALVGAAALRRPALAALHVTAGSTVGHSRRVLRELAHNSHALLAFFALSNADVLIARVTLDEQQSGLYAGGLILAKAVLFLPQFVVVIAFPSMSASDARFAMMLRALGLVLLIGLGATAVALTLPELAVAFVGGEAYGALAGTIWAFAGLGTLLAMIQLLIYNVVAQQAKRAVLVVWLGLVALFALSSAVSSVGFLLTAVVAVEALVLLALMGLGLRGRARTGSAANGG